MRYLTVKEFADITGFTKQTITKWCRKGKLRAIQPAGRTGKWGIHPEEVAPYEKEVDVTK